MKKIEKFAASLIGLGMLGAVILAGSAEMGLATFLKCEVPCFALMLIGVAIQNKTAEDESPAANTMKCDSHRNS